MPSWRLVELSHMVCIWWQIQWWMIAFQKTFCILAYWDKTKVIHPMNTSIATQTFTLAIPAHNIFLILSVVYDSQLFIGFLKVFNSIQADIELIFQSCILIPFLLFINPIWFQGNSSKSTRRWDDLMGSLASATLAETDSRRWSVLMNFASFETILRTFFKRATIGSSAGWIE